MTIGRFRGPGGPGDLENHPKGRGASPPTFVGDFTPPRGRAAQTPKTTDVQPNPKPPSVEHRGPRQDPGVLLKDPGVIVEDPGVLYKDPGVLFKDPGVFQKGPTGSVVFGVCAAPGPPGPPWTGRRIGLCEKSAPETNSKAISWGFRRKGGKPVNRPTGAGGLRAGTLAGRSGAAWAAGVSGRRAGNSVRLADMAGQRSRPATDGNQSPRKSASQTASKNRRVPSWATVFRDVFLTRFQTAL